MRQSPPIPDWLHRFRHPAYTNIYELSPQETRIFGTESLYGDWDAETLLLAKDFAPACLIHHRVRTGCDRPYHHSDWTGRPPPPGARTNRTLHACAEALPGRKLYGSAFGGLLRNDDKLSGRLPDFDHLCSAYAAPLMRFAAASMPNLRAIACLGKEAWVCAARAFELGDGADWAEWHERAAPQRIETAGRQVSLFAMRHPSRGSSRDCFSALATELDPLPIASQQPTACPHCDLRSRRAA